MHLFHVGRHCGRDLRCPAALCFITHGYRTSPAPGAAGALGPCGRAVKRCARDEDEEEEGRGGGGGRGKEEEEHRDTH
eukprot:9391274-Pyramimonas_sp.AAC.1